MRSQYRGITAPRMERRGSRIDGDAPSVEVKAVEQPANRTRCLLLSIILIAITFGVFQSTHNYQFLSWDDKFNIVINTHMNRAGGPDYATYWTHPFLYTYRPLIYEVWSVIAAHARLAAPRFAPGIGDYQFDPNPFHLFNLILHPINAVLVFVILRIFVKNDWAAFAGALLFGIHPLQVESVAWITGGNELLYGFFALLALWQYLCYAITARDIKAAGITATARQANKYSTRQWLHYGAACVFFALALFTKPTAVCLPLAALALDIWAVRRAPLKAVFALAPWFAASVGWVYVTAWARELDTTVAQTALWIRPFVAGDAISFYLYKLILPFNLAMEYGRTPKYVMAHPWVYAMFLIPIALCAGLIAFRRTSPLLLAAFLVFMAALVPTIGLVPNNYQFYSTVADHYMYLAMLGPAIAVGWLLSRVNIAQISGKFAITACALFLAFCGTLAATHARDYRNDETLYAHTIAANPISWVSHYNYGRYLADQGKLDPAAVQLQAAVTLKPDLSDGFNNLGVTLGALGRDQEALEFLQKACTMEPQNVFYLISLAPQYEKMNRYADAVTTYTLALQYDPNNPESEFHLGMDLSALGQFSDAATHLDRSLQIAPGNPVAENNLALALARQGKITDAVPHWQRAIQLQPSYANAHYNYGAALENLKRTQEAITEYQTAARLAPESAVAQNALARLAPNAGKH